MTTTTAPTPTGATPPGATPPRATPPGATPPRAPGLGALVGSESLRARSRRSLLWLVAGSLFAVTGAAAAMWLSTARVTGADLDAAAQRFPVEQTQITEDCLSDPSIPTDQEVMSC